MSRRNLASIGDKSRNCATTCRFESVLSIDARGQIVIPKETRERACITAGGKLALVTSECDEKICCFVLLKTEALSPDILSLILGGGSSSNSP